MVHGGKYSEGYNFKDDLCRGIIMVGVPHSNISDPKIIMKERFYLKHELLFTKMEHEK